jgi:hypothetical protein
MLVVIPRTTTHVIIHGRALSSKHVLIATAAQANLSTRATVPKPRPACYHATRRTSSVCYHAAGRRSQHYAPAAAPRRFVS